MITTSSRLIATEHTKSDDGGEGNREGTGGEGPVGCDLGAGWNVGSINEVAVNHKHEHEHHVF